MKIIYYMIIIVLVLDVLNNIILVIWNAKDVQVIVMSVLIIEFVWDARGIIFYFRESAENNVWMDCMNIIIIEQVLMNVNNVMIPQRNAVNV